LKKLQKATFTFTFYMCPLCGENHYQTTLFHIRNVVALFFKLLYTSGNILEDGETHTKEQCF